VGAIVIMEMRNLYTIRDDDGVELKSVQLANSVFDVLFAALSRSAMT
jgi:hypothetical protein